MYYHPNLTNFDPVYEGSKIDELGGGGPSKNSNFEFSGWGPPLPKVKFFRGGGGGTV